MITISALPNPFEPPVLCRVEPGCSLAEILGGAADDVHVTLDGETIPYEDWPGLCPLDGAFVTAVNMPRGPLKIPIAVAVGEAVLASAGAAFGAAAGVALGVTAALATVAGLSYALYAVSSLIKPQQQQNTSNNIAAGRYNALTGGQNQATPWQPIPKLYGTFRVTPPLAAKYYTNSNRTQQYLHILLCLGYGPLQIDGHIVGAGHNKIGWVKDDTGDTWELHTDLTDASAIRIGQTNIGEFAGVQWEIGAPGQITLYPTQVDEQTLSIALPRTGTGAGGWIADGNAAVRTTGTDAERISLDIACNALISADAMGHQSGITIEFKIEYRASGTTTWTTAVNSWQPHAESRSPVRFSREFRVPSPGQYDIRLTRIRTWIDYEDTVFADVTWTALRSVGTTPPWNANPPAGAGSVVLLAMKIRASGQLNGTVDGVNVLASAVLPVWNGSAWVQQATNSPAWAYVDALRGPQLRDPIALDRLDRDAMVAWAAECAASGLEYNWYHTSTETLVARLRAIATTGRATWAMPAGKWSAIRDSNFVPVQLVTPKNSWGFQFERRYPVLPDALRVQYIDPATWQQAERITYNDGFNETNATVYEVLQTQGVTSADQAHKEGRYFLAELKLRPETYTFNMDFENLVAQRGDCLYIAHDVLLVGLAYGRIKSIVGSVLLVDETLPMEAGKTYGLRVRKADNTYSVVTLETVAGMVQTVTATVPLTGISPGDLFAFGETGLETFFAKIVDIQYQPDFSAQITAVPAAPEIVNVDTEEIPAWDPGITIPWWLERPLPPVITLISQTSESVFALPDGSWAENLQVQWFLPASRIMVDLVEISYQVVDMPTQIVRASPDVVSAILPNIPVFRTVAVMARARGVNGRWSAYSDPSSFEIGSDGTLLAPAPTDVVATPHIDIRPDGTVDNGLLLSWHPPAAGRVNHYGIEWQATGTANWFGATASREATHFLIGQLDPSHTYDLRIRNINPLGVASAWVTLTGQTPGTKADPPGPPSGLSAQGDLRAIAYAWTNPTDADFAKTEIWASQANDRTTASLIGSSSGTSLVFATSGPGTWYAWARAVDTTGNTSTWEPSGINAGVAAYAQDEWDRGITINGPAIYNGFEGADYDRWQTDGSVAIAHSGVVATGSNAGLVTSDGGSNGIRLALPDIWVRQLAGRRIRLQAWVRSGTPGTPAVVGRLGAVFNPGAVDVGVGINFTGAYAQVGTLVAIPAAATSGYLYFLPDTSNTAGYTALIDAVSAFVVPDQINADNIDEWIGSAAIGNAYIANAAIDTLQLAGQSVSVQRYGYGIKVWNGSAYSGDVCALAIASVPTGTRGAMLINVEGNIGNPSSVNREYRILVYRDGSLLPHENTQTAKARIPSGGIGSICGVFIDYPDENQHVYTIKVQNMNSNHSKSVARLALLVNEGKR